MKKTILILIILLISILSYSQIVEELVAWEYGPTEAIAVKDSTAYISSGSYLWVLDISDESNPTLVDEIKLENYIHYIRRIGNYLYVSKNDTILNIYDIKTADNPTLVNQMHGTDANYNWNDIYIDNDTLYICGKGTLQYFINDTINLEYIRKIPSGSQFSKHDTLGITIIWDYNNFRIFNLNVPGDIVISDDSYPLSESPKGIFVDYPYTYFGYGSEGVGIMDINNIYDIQLYSTIITNGYTYDIELIEDTIMIAARGLNGIGIYDVDDDTIFTLIGECDTDGYAYELEVIGDRLYVGARSGGLQIIDIGSKTNPILLGEYQGYGECRRIDIEGDRLYVASGDGGLMIMDITTRTDPTVISQCYSRHIAEDVVKQGNYVYMADGDSGLTIFDITDENNPSIYGFNPVQFYSEQIEVYNNYCAVGGWVDMNGDTMKNGIGLVNISNPSTPIHINSINNGHDRIEMQLVDTFLHTISVAGVRTRYAIWDISDMGNAYIRDTLIGDFGAMHKLTIENDTTIFEYGSTEIEIYNSGDVDNIIQIDSIEKPSWSLFLKKYGGYLFEVDYYNNIKVWDISDIPNADTIARTDIKSELLDLLKTGDIIYTTHTKYGLSIFNFNPTGIEDKQIYNKQDNISITTTFKSISINNQTGIPQKYQLMDITGRIVNTIEAKNGITVITPKKSGVYFIVDKDNLMKNKFIIIR